MSNQLNIGIVIGSVREGRRAEPVANWILDFAQQRGDANYELVDLADYPLPFLGAATDQPDAEEVIASWSEKMASFDGYIFVTPEYNHAIGGALKNALLDFLNPESTIKQLILLDMAASAEHVHTKTCA